MKIFKGNSIEQVYKELITELQQRENLLIESKTYEINNCCLIINNPTNVFTFPKRNISEKYANAELNWYYSADNSCKTIGKYAKMWLNLTDDGETNNSAYGYILFKKYGFNQLEQIIELLKKDKFSRRAVLNISDPAINRITTKDMQCTIAIQFLIRNNKLEETVYMRSNDVYFGLPYDYIFFVSLGLYIAQKLNIEFSQYIHHATSMHMYLRDVDKFNSEQSKLITINFNKYYEVYYDNCI